MPPPVTFRIAATALRRNLMRTVLTTLGMIICRSPRCRCWSAGSA
jgi:hypothetical protein